jgi:cobalamin transport system substrate-binding protein
VGTLAVGRVRGALVATSLLLLLGATACGERSEPTGRLVGIYPVTVQGAGDRPAVVRAVPRRIVPLGAGPRRILKALGLDGRIVTVNDSLVGLPLVGVVRRARPDLIVASSDTDPLDLARARTSTNAAIYVEPSASLDEVVRAIGDIGQLTGRPLAARRVTASIQAKRDDVQKRLAAERTVTVFVDTGDFSTIPSRTLLGDLVRAGHGRSVAGSSPEQGAFPLRRLVQLNPEVYIATADSGRTLRGLRANPTTRRLRAVRNGRFGVISAAAVIPGPGVGNALIEVARILHPDAFR